MTKEIWLNLPVKDIQKSMAFFKSLGMSFNEQHTNEVSACLLVGSKNFVVMLFAQSVFEGFTKTPITDTNKSSELLISIDAESREEVDEMAKKVIGAGGKMYSLPAENQGWMYGCAFADLDGHKWNILFMDMSKLPK